MVVKFFLLFLLYASVEGKRKGAFHRIVGGDFATIEMYPYTASVRYKSAHYCGGAIVSDRYIATAAHCYRSMKKKLDKLSVVLGATASSLDGEKYQIETYKPHEKFNEATGVNDVAVIKVIGQITFGPKMQPIALAPPGTDVPVGAMTTVTGWGSSMRRSTQTLKAAKIPRVTDKECIEAYKKIRNITSDMMCTGYPEGKIDACQGDSGGPLVYKKMLVGVVSFGLGCGRANTPGVYMKLANYYNWFKKSMV